MGHGAALEWLVRPLQMIPRFHHFILRPASVLRVALFGLATSLLLGFVLLSWPADLFAGEGAPVASSEAAGELLLEGHQALLAGEVDQAVELLDRALGMLAGSEDRQLLLAVRVNRAHALAQAGRLLESMAEFAAAIPHADVLAANVALHAPDLGVGVRLQLAEMLVRFGSATDSEAAAWDALEAAVRLGELQLAGPAVRMVLQLGAVRDASPEGLTALLDAVSLLLLELDEYRLATQPPPEPLISMLEQIARALASQSEFDAARDLFELITLLDLARGAHWRLTSDLSDLSWVALQQRDLAFAHWSLRWSEALVQGKRPADLLANWSALQAEAGEYAAAEASCQAALRRSAEEQSAARSLALRARLARIVEASHGREGEALALYRKSAAAYREAGEGGAALAEEVRVAELMLADGRIEDAAVVLAGVVGGLSQGSVMAADEQVRLHLANARLSELRGELEISRSALSSAGKLLFDLGRLEDLAALGSRFGDLELRAGNLDAAGEAYRNGQSLEAQLGLGAESWQALFGLSRLAAAQGDGKRAIELLDEASARIEWLAGQQSALGFSAEIPGEQAAPLLDWDWEDVYRALVRRHLDAGRTEEALQTVHRAGQVRRLNLLKGHRGLTATAEEGSDLALLAAVRSRIDQLRRQLRDAAARPSLEDPTAHSADLLQQLSEARKDEREVLHRLGASDPRFLAEVSVVPVSGTELRGELAAGTVLLASYDLVGRIAMFAVGPSKVTAWQVEGTPAQQRSKLDQLWQEFGGRRVSLRLRHKLRGRLAVWAKRLLAPGAAELESASTILWAPDKALRTLPIAALPLANGILGERSTVLGVDSLHGDLADPTAKPAGAAVALSIVDGVAERTAVAVPDLETLASQLRGLRRGNSVLSGTGSSRVAATGTRLLLLSARVAERQRVGLRELAGGARLVSSRPVLAEDRFVRRFTQELQSGNSILSSFEQAQRRARQVRRDPLGWASLTLFVR